MKDSEFRFFGRKKEHKENLVRLAVFCFLVLLLSVGLLFGSFGPPPPPYPPRRNKQEKCEGSSGTVVAITPGRRVRSAGNGTCWDLGRQQRWGESCWRVSRKLQRNPSTGDTNMDTDTDSRRPLKNRVQEASH